MSLCKMDKGALMLQFVFQSFEAKPLNLQMLYNLKEKRSIFSKLFAVYDIFFFNEGKKANIEVLWALEYLIFNIYYFIYNN